MTGENFARSLTTPVGYLLTRDSFVILGTGALRRTLAGAVS